MKIARARTQINGDGLQKNPDEEENKLNENNEIDNAPPSLGNISVKSASDIRRLLVGIINQLRKQNFDVQNARAQIYAAHELREVFAHIDLEERIRKLEEKENYGGM